MKLFTVILVSLSFVLLGCGGSKQAPPKNESNMPDFVLNPPSVPGKLYGTGIAKKKSEQLAKEVADLNAKKEIASILGTKVSNLTMQFMGESGIKRPEVTEFSQSITKAITDQTLVGVVIEKREFIDETTYSLAVLDLSQADVKEYITKQVTEALTSKEALLSEFRAKQGFEQLDKELEKLQNKE